MQQARRSFRRNRCGAGGGTRSFQRWLALVPLSVFGLCTVGPQVAVAATATGPSAAIQAAPSLGSAPLAVNFNGSQSFGSSGTIASWNLSFGDGTPDARGVGAPSSTIGHVYVGVGTFTANLTVTNRSAATAVATTSVTVNPPGAGPGGNVGVVDVAVTGSPLTDLSTAPIALTPKFSAANTDYALYCTTGTNKLTLTLRSSGSIASGGQTGTSLALPVSVVSNQAIVVTTSSTTYWIRCLPSTFPHITTKGSGGLVPGYYVTGTFRDRSHGTPGYPIILNSYGTPVWYLTGVPFSGDNVELLPGTHTVAWSNQGPYSLYDMATGTVSWVAPPTPPPDEHELYTDSSGNRWMISVPLRTGYNLAPVGFPKNHNVVGCVVQELDPQGVPIWSWDASAHVSALETNKLAYLTTDQGAPAVDLYHCNSVDVDPLNPDHILVSMREAGVFLIDKTTGSILWKFGGTSVTPLGNEPVLSIVGDPEGAIQGQHDLRFQPNGQISMFDDHTGLVGPARGIAYTIDAGSGTATMAWEFAAPSGARTSRMGSVRRYDAAGSTYDQSGAAYLGTQETLIDWGQGVPVAGFTLVDNFGGTLMESKLEKPFVGNRAEFVPSSALDLAQLRATAGTAFP